MLSTVPTIRFQPLLPQASPINAPYVEPPEESSRSETQFQPPQPARETSNIIFKLWEGESFSFGDLLDIINPLQHLPVISTLYRSLTHDKIGALPRILGAALYGRISGIPGLISSVLNAVIGAFTGKDIGERIYAMVFGEPQAPKEQPALAQGLPSPDSAQSRESAARDRIPVPFFVDDSHLPETKGLAESYRHVSGKIDPILPVLGGTAASVTAVERSRSENLLLAQFRMEEVEGWVVTTLPPRKNRTGDPAPEEDASAFQTWATGNKPSGIEIYEQMKPLLGDAPGYKRWEGQTRPRNASYLDAQ